MPTTGIKFRPSTAHACGFAANSRKCCPTGGGLICRWAGEGVGPIGLFSISYFLLHVAVGSSCCLLGITAVLACAQVGRIPVPPLMFPGRLLVPAVVLLRLMK